MENVMASVFGQIQLILSFLGGVAKFVWKCGFDDVPSCWGDFIGEKIGKEHWEGYCAKQQAVFFLKIW